MQVGDITTSALLHKLGVKGKPYKKLQDQVTTAISTMRDAPDGVSRDSRMIGWSTEFMRSHAAPLRCETYEASHAARQKIRTWMRFSSCT